MFTLGLDDHRFLSFQAGVFKFLTNVIYCKNFFAREKRYGLNLRAALFPQKTEIHSIANSRASFHRLCAADDLDLSLYDQHDQIELFKFVGEQEPYQSSYDFKPPVSISATRQPIPIYDKNDDTYNGFVEPASAPYPEGYSHYYLNMMSMQNPESHTQPYFNDFAGSFDIQAPVFTSSSVSSTESHISPLDDELFKKLSWSEFEDCYEPNQLKKRRYNSLEKSHDECPAPPVVIKKEPNAKKVKVERSDKKSEPFECPHCDASFKVKGYLSRHLKKHSSAKAFSCPFYEEPSGSRSGSKCHPTGGFSRRDTFKTHLKALHFIYPPGTKSSERNSISGRCAGCFSFFESNVQWLAKHIEKGECTGTVSRKNQANGNAL